MRLHTTTATLFLAFHLVEMVTAAEIPPIPALQIKPLAKPKITMESSYVFQGRTGLIRCILRLTNPFDPMYVDKPIVFSRSSETICTVDDWKTCPTANILPNSYKNCGCSYNWKGLGYQYYFYYFIDKNAERFNNEALTCTVRDTMLSTTQLVKGLTAIKVPKPHIYVCELQSLRLEWNLQNDENMMKLFPYESAILYFKDTMVAKLLSDRVNFVPGLKIVNIKKFTMDQDFRTITIVLSKLHTNNSGQYRLQVNYENNTPTQSTPTMPPNKATTTPGAKVKVFTTASPNTQGPETRRKMKKMGLRWRRVVMKHSTTTTTTRVTRRRRRMRRMRRRRRMRLRLRGWARNLSTTTAEGSPPPPGDVETNATTTPNGPSFGGRPRRRRAAVHESGQTTEKPHLQTFLQFYHNVTVTKPPSGGLYLTLSVTEEINMAIVIYTCTIHNYESRKMGIPPCNVSIYSGNTRLVTQENPARLGFRDYGKYKGKGRCSLECPSLSCLSHDDPIRKNATRTLSENEIKVGGVPFREYLYGMYMVIAIAMMMWVISTTVWHVSMIARWKRDIEIYQNRIRLKHRARELHISTDARK